MTLSREHIADLVNLYHLARTALACEKDQGRWARMNWAAKEFSKAHPDIAVKWSYLALDRALA